MKLLKTSILGFLIVFTFVGNIGMSVYTHSCEEDGVFRSYFINQEDQCAEHKKTEENLPPCCQKVKTVAKSCVLKDDCCSDDVSVYQLHFPYYSVYKQIVKLHQIVVPIAFQSFTVNNILFSKQDVKQIINPPPILSGREILIQHQVFRI